MSYTLYRYETDQGRFIINFATDNKKAVIDKLNVNKDMLYQIQLADNSVMEGMGLELVKELIKRDENSAVEGHY